MDMHKQIDACLLLEVYAILACLAVKFVFFSETEKDTMHCCTQLLVSLANIQEYLTNCTNYKWSCTRVTLCT
uniref:Uncharacterized protein n=1 Tax=Oryza brachyantha TaxID=4533 RepID=J3M1G3_ORYBR